MALCPDLVAFSDHRFDWFDLLLHSLSHHGSGKASSVTPPQLAASLFEFFEQCFVVFSLDGFRDASSVGGGVLPVGRRGSSSQAASVAGTNPADRKKTCRE